MKEEIDLTKSDIDKLRGSVEVFCKDGYKRP